MSFENIATIIFIILLALLIYIKRKKIEIQKIIFPLIYVILWRTTLGLEFMRNLAKRFPKALKIVGYIGVYVGFLGMAAITYSLIDNLIKILTVPSATAGVALVLPFKVPGAFFVPFFYWIISIFILAVIHEASHGIISRVHNVKIKSSGFAFLSILVPIIPAAFVEPDEKTLAKRSVKQQLSVFAAGPFSNIITAFICLGILLFIFSPVAENMLDFTGVKITSLIDEYPAKNAGITEGEIITQVDDKLIEDVTDFIEVLDTKSPGDFILIQTNLGKYDIKLAENPDDDGPYLGVNVEQERKIKDDVKEKYFFLPNIFLWFSGLFYWLFILNFGIGLFNLVPVGPIDGGRMLRLVLFKKFNEKTASKIFSFVSYFFVILILSNLLFAFIK